jgi:hypothetical protein
MRVMLKDLQVDYEDVKRRANFVANEVTLQTGSPMLVVHAVQGEKVYLEEIALQKTRTTVRAMRRFNSDWQVRDRMWLSGLIFRGPTPYRPAEVEGSPAAIDKFRELRPRLLESGTG